METAVRTSVQNVDDAVFKSSEQQTGSGTTAVFALAFHQQILLAHLGDSKAVLCQHVQLESALRQTDKLNLRAEPLTVDHSPDRPDERARIVAAGGTISTATAGEQPTDPDCSAAPCSFAHADETLLLVRYCMPPIADRASHGLKFHILFIHLFMCSGIMHGPLSLCIVL